MKHGKATCKILKEIRRDIAAQNNIPLEERECTHEGDCHGTCPYCESKVQYLDITDTIPITDPPQDSL